MNLPSRGYRPRGQAACSRARCVATSCCTGPTTFRSRSVLLQRIKDLSVQAFVPQLSIEAFAVSVLPGTARFDRQAFPFPLPPATSADPPRRTQIHCSSECFPGCPEQHHIRHRFDHFVPPQPSCHADRQALPRVFIDHRQHSVRSGAHEVVAPHAIRPFRSQPYTTSVVQPQSSSWPLFLRHFEPLATPDALHPILPNMPACFLQQRGNPAVAVASVFTGQLDGFNAQRSMGSLRAPCRSRYVIGTSGGSISTTIRICWMKTCLSSSSSTRTQFHSSWFRTSCAGPRETRAGERQRRTCLCRCCGFHA